MFKIHVTHRLQKKLVLSLASTMMCTLAILFYFIQVQSLNASIYFDPSKYPSNKLIPNEVYNVTDQCDAHLMNTVHNSLFEKITDKEFVNSSWKLINHFINSKLSTNNEKDKEYIDNFVKNRKNYHIYDPRITLAVYLNCLNELYNQESIEIPFSWEDWVDLSYLNKFLSNENSTCAEFYNHYDIENKFNIVKGEPSSKFSHDTFCLDNEEYLLSEESEFRDPKLLPGFNFMRRMKDNSDFIGKAISAKSFLNSYARAPTFIYFLNDNGTYYKAKPLDSSSMSRNDLLDNFLKKESYNGFNPIDEISKLNKKYLFSNPNSFLSQLSNTLDFKVDIPESSFILNPKSRYDYLFEQDSTRLEVNELNFINGLRFSLDTKPDGVKKHFLEANIHFPTTYQGHDVKENGGHYDARFFSGLITEMPFSEYTLHSPNYVLDKLMNNNVSDKSFNVANVFENDYYFQNTSHVGNSIGYRNSVLSHLQHILFTLTFQEGLIIHPAHGSLLSWYFTSLTFPWDADGDIQMPIADLAEFCLRFNNSMVVENPRYGTSKAFIDCSSSLTHRRIGLGNNAIDARVIDVDTGLYIDITGLSVSADSLTEKNYKQVKDWLPDSFIESYTLQNEAYQPDKVVIDRIPPEDILKIHKEYRIYNCRNHHYYTYEQLSPLRLSLMEGAPTFVASNKKALRSMLEVEYSENSLRNPVWEDWVFSTPLKMWIHATDIFKALLDNGIDIFSELNETYEENSNMVTGSKVFKYFLKHEPLVISSLVRSSVNDITGVNNLTNNSALSNLNIVEELFHNNYFTSAHVRELSLTDTTWKWHSSNIDDQSNLPHKWNDLANWMIRDHAPPKKPIFDYLIFVDKVNSGKEPSI